MARAKTATKPGEQGGHTWEGVFAGHVHRGLTLSFPWLAWLLTISFGTIVRLAWPHDWVVAFPLVIIGAFLAALTYHLTHSRTSRVARLIAPATCVLGFGWIGYLDWTGWHHGAVQSWLLGGIAVCGAWDAWCVIRVHDSEASLADLFNGAATAAGHEGVKLFGLTVHRGNTPVAAIRAGKNKAEIGAPATPMLEAAKSGARGGLIRRVTGTVQLKPGEHTADDFAKAALNIESGAQLPPGAITVTRDEDDASRALVTISDPRLLRQVHPWPGPSNPGGSIMDPLRIGIWQDAEPCVVHGTAGHDKVMGCTGSGKSIGWAWNFLGEAMTRRDVIIRGIDIAKGQQTLGPLAPALTRLDGSPGFAQTRDEARAMLRGVYDSLMPRTNYLAERGYMEWKPGCGLKYEILLLEEVPDIFALIGDDTPEYEMFLELVRKIRSAGGKLIMSLQRGDWTQMPTFVRGQLNSVCGGVLNEQDASFGLSSYQNNHGCSPEDWGQRYPGMFYVDGPKIDMSRRAMPMRSFFWGDDASLMRAHAAQYPAESRPADDLTAAIMAGRPIPASVSRGAATIVPLGGTAKPQEATPVNRALDSDTDLSDMDLGLPGASPAAPQPQPAGDGDDTEFTDAELDADLDPQWDQARPADDGGEPAAEARDADEDLPLPGPLVGIVDFSDPDAVAESELTPAEARAAFWDAIVRIAADPENHGVVMARHLNEVCETIGRKRPWLHSELNRLEREGMIRKRGSTYPAKWAVRDDAAA